VPTREAVRRNIRTKSKYVVPNSITAMSMILGLISMYYAYNHQFVIAAWVILYSTVLDKLDGSTARVLNASSEFGVQMDSFSDLIAFGIAPAFLVFAICSGDPDVSAYFLSKETPFFLYFSLVFFVLASMLRLARFNVTTLPGDRFMIGLATTGAGGLIATYVLTCYGYKDNAFVLKLLQGLPYYLMILGALMISNLPMTKVGKKKTALGRGLEMVVMISVLICIITRSLPEYLLASGAFYTLIGFYQGFQGREEFFASQRALRQSGDCSDVDDDLAAGQSEVKASDAVNGETSN
jgi:CDP-diacylglycerol--serine O-phosphatidyltransferase